MNTQLRCFIVLLLFLGALPMRANSSFALDRCANLSLENHFQVLIDSSQKLSLSQVLLHYKQGKFVTPSANQAISSSITGWVRIELINRCPGQLMWLLHLNTQVSHVWAYPFVQKDSMWQTLPADSSFSVIYIACNRILLPAPYQQQMVYFLKLENHLDMPASLHDIYLSPSTSYTRYWLSHGLLVGLALGGLFVMMLYGLITYLEERRWVFLNYFFYTFFVGAYIAMVTFVGEQFVFAGHSWWSLKCEVLLLVALLFYFPFIRGISINKTNAKIDRWVFKPFIYFTLVNSSVVSSVAFINEGIFYQLFNLSLAVYSLFALFIVFALWRTNQRIGKTILVGMVAMVSGGCLSLVFGLLDNMEENHLYNLGVYIELVIFTYAMIQMKSQVEKDNQQKELALLDSKNKIEYKQRELAQKALHVAQQDEILNKIKVQLEEIKGERPHTNDVLLNVLSDIDFYLKQTSWNDFEQYFIEVHPGFYRNLKAAYPDLSQMELRVCAMLKLNFNTKQMADIFQKTPKSIDVTRTRIRQKMNLSREENLFDKLASL